MKYLQPIAMAFPQEQQEQEGEFFQYFQYCVALLSLENELIRCASLLSAAIATTPTHGLRSCTTRLSWTLTSLV